jgi:Ca2+-binding RTX toxin-like protein
MAIINGTPLDDTNLVSLHDGDVVNGLAGNDTLTAAHNNVTLNGGSGADVLYSNAGTDGTTMDGGSGNDVLAGGGTNNTASYESLANDPAHVGVDGVVVDLSSFSATDGTGGTDILVGIQNVTGSAFDDSLTGDDLANVLQGGAGDDRLTGDGGADAFKYSFTPTSGQGSTSTFTDWLSDKYGKDFGDELPDFSPRHNSWGNHCGDDRHDAPASGLTENFFEQNYKEWLKEVVVVDLQEQGFVLDKNHDGKVKIDINDDSRNGTPLIEGLTKHQLDGIFGDRDSVILNDHGDTEKAWYSNSFTSGQGENTVASTDGFDTIVDFKWGVDHLEFHGLGAGFTLAQFTKAFDVTQTDVDHNGTMDTVLSLADHTWAVTLLDVSAPPGASPLTEADFHATSVFS